MNIPKPVPFGGGIPEEKHESNTEQHKESRRSLRQEIERLRSSLTSQETKYLEELCIHGNEIEVSLAKERLKNTSLFFESEGEWSVDAALEPDQSKSQVVIDMGSFRRSLTQKAASMGQLKQEQLKQEHCTKSQASQGSEKRQQSLELRRKSGFFPKLWRAHETGLSLSKIGSRRSLLNRPPSGVFRPKKQRPSFHRSTSLGGIRDTKEKKVHHSVTGNPIRPLLRRLQSERTRAKSVSFGEIPRQKSLRRESSDLQSAPSIHKASPLRSESLSSIPSIHHAHPIAQASDSSIPSLHHAHPVRSESFRSSSASIPSIHHANRVKSDSQRSNALSSVVSDLGESWDDSAEEKKMEPPPLPEKVEIRPKNELERPVMIRDASVSLYQGEGMEIADVSALEHHVQNHRDSSSTTRNYKNMLSFGDLSTIRSSNSYDESVSYERLDAIFRRTSIARSLSDDTESMAGIINSDFIDYIGESLLDRDISQSSLTLTEEDLDHYDSWKVLEDNSANGYGTLPFRILGTSAEDIHAHPHVLSPPLMESLQEFLPPVIYGQNFWMKYSLVRDGASMYTFMKNARGSQYCFLAIETVDGEVFGAFTSQPWRKNWNYFGGQDSFLWRMTHTRNEMSHSILEQAQMESEIEVFPFSGNNSNVQLCTHDMLAVGGGGENGSIPNGPYKQHEWGFGLTLVQDLLEGTSSPCLTFNSPSLSKVHSDGSIFEIMNIELWTMTPCYTLDDADRLELGKLFLEHHRQ